MGNRNGTHGFSQNNVTDAVGGEEETERKQQNAKLQRREDDSMLHVERERVRGKEVERQQREEEQDEPQETKKQNSFGVFCYNKVGD